MKDFGFKVCTMDGERFYLKSTSLESEAKLDRVLKKLEFVIKCFDEDDFLKCTECGADTPWMTLDIHKQALCGSCNIKRT